jgi:hypothetical protein
LGGASFSQGEGIIVGVKELICIATVDEVGTEVVLDSGDGDLARSIGEDEMLESDLILVIAGN